MTGVRVVREDLRAQPAELARRWAHVVTHTHNLRVRQVGFDEAKRQLRAWCRRHGVDALGLGSPWEPVSAERFGRYEGPERDRYYGGQVDVESVMDREPIGALFDELNRATDCATHFYIDNETPKCRYGHLWYFGWHYDVPAWHDYDQGRPIQYYAADPHLEINPVDGRPHRRRPYLEVVARQRAAGALAIWAHPTSWWWDEGRFVTNIAAEMVLHLLVDGHLDGLAVMGYDAYHAAYQALWFHLLDTGAVVPGFAESDSCFDRRDLLQDRRVLHTVVPAKEALGTAAIVDCARRGHAFATSGPFVDLSVDGVPMGAIRESSRGVRHRVRIEAYPAPGETALSRLELVGRGGQALWRRDGFPGGVVDAEIGGVDEPAWLLVRAFGQDDDPDRQRQQDIAHCALSNPVYLQPRGWTFAAVGTLLELDIAKDSPWLGGRIVYESAVGMVLGTSLVAAGVQRQMLPGSARVRLQREGLEDRVFYLAMENEAVQAHLRYLHDGEFLRDHPGLVPGQVPVEAFRIEAMRQALQHCRVAV